MSFLDVLKGCYFETKLLKIIFGRNKGGKGGERLNK